MRDDPEGQRSAILHYESRLLSDRRWKWLISFGLPVALSVCHALLCSLVIYSVHTARPANPDSSALFAACVMLFYIADMPATLLVMWVFNEQGVAVFGSSFIAKVAWWLASSGWWFAVGVMCQKVFRWLQRNRPWRGRGIRT